MKTYNHYILTVAVSLLLTTVLLAALGQESLDFYYTLYIIEALLITEFYAYFNIKARRGLTVVGALLFAGFLAIITVETLRLIIR